jgi:hypothetical protein
MVFDPISQRIVLATSGDLTQFYELWSYDGVDWTPLPALGTASAPQPLYGGDVSAVLGAGDRLLFVNLARVHELLATPASASTFGQACGTAPPALAAMSLPRPGIAGFGLELTGVPSNSVAAIVGADAPAAVPLLGCTLLVAPGQLLQLLATSASGYASLPLPLPAGPGLLGLPFYFQGAALSTGSPGGVAFSAGLRVSIGH